MLLENLKKRNYKTESAFLPEWDFFSGVKKYHWKIKIKKGSKIECATMINEWFSRLWYSFQVFVWYSFQPRSLLSAASLFNISPLCWSRPGAIIQILLSQISGWGRAFLFSVFLVIFFELDCWNFQWKGQTLLMLPLLLQCSLYHTCFPTFYAFPHLPQDVWHVFLVSLLFHFEKKQQG